MNNLKLLLGALLLTTSQTMMGQGAKNIVISEVLTGNANSVVDEFGQREAWIELENTSFSTYNVRGMFITTNRQVLDKSLSAPERIKLMSTIQSHSTSNATSFAQAGALEALRLDHTCLDEMRQTFETRRRVILDSIAELPDVTCLAPKGAFYVLINCKKYCNIEHGLHWIQNDVDLAKYILEEGHVATIPGSAFGAPGYLRLSFALDEDNIRKGIARIGESLKKLNA